MDTFHACSVSTLAAKPSASLPHQSISGLELFKAHGFGLVVAFYAFRIGMFVIPDMLGRLAFGEEQQVGFDAGVGAEHAIGQAHDGVQVAFFQQFFLEAGFHAFAEEETIGQDHGGAALVFEQLDDQRHKQVSGFTGAKVAGKVVFDAVFFHAAKGRVGDDDVDPVFVGVVRVRAAQGVVVPDVGGCVDAVQNHVGDAQHMGQRFLLDTMDGCLQGFFVIRRFYVIFAFVVDGAGEKAAGAAGRVEHGFVQFRVDAD